MDSLKDVSAKMEIFSEMGSIWQCLTAIEGMSAKTPPNSLYSPLKMVPRVSPHGCSSQKVLSALQRSENTLAVSTKTYLSRALGY